MNIKITPKLKEKKEQKKKEFRGSQKSDELTDK